MGSFATGVTVVTVSLPEGVRGMTANAFMSGSLDPPLVVISVGRQTSMHAHLLRASSFGVSVLSAGQLDVAAHFGGKPVEGLTASFVFTDGTPTLADAVATMTATVADQHACGDHTLFIGRIQQMVGSDRVPLLFHGGRYASLVPDSTLPPAPDMA